MIDLGLSVFIEILERLSRLLFFSFLGAASCAHNLLRRRLLALTSVVFTVGIFGTLLATMLAIVALS